MSWLYSLVFAGLVFSSSTDLQLNTNTNVAVSTNVSINKSDEIEKFDQTYPLNADGRVSVSNVNGSIVVEAWDRNEVKVEATKIADSKETLADTEIKVDARPEYLAIEVNCDSWKQDRGWRNNRKVEVQFHLWVPRTAVLNEIETVNGNVTVSNFVNMTKISAVNGDVNATNLRGTANLSTVNGEVKADFDRLENSSRISLSTVNGRVSLIIPSDSSAKIKADSLNGSITNDFGLPVRKGQYVGRDLYGQLGSGAVQIKLDSVNGPLSVGRKNDGKTLSPATNLLPAKGKDEDNDEDWDNDDESLKDKSDKKAKLDKEVVNTAKLNREVARAVRQSQVDSRAAVREAQRAAANVRVVVPRIKVEDLEKMKIEIDGKELEKSIRDLEGQNFEFNWMNADWRANAPVIEKKRNTFPVKGTPKVNVEARGCSVKVRGWDRSEVQYVVTEIAGRRDREPITVGESNSDSEVTIKVTNPNEEMRNDLYNSRDRVRIEVFVPRKSNLKIDTDGEIRLDGVSGDVELKGQDESINVRDVDGRMHVATESGQVRIIGFKGQLDSNTTDADVYLEGSFDKLTSKAVNGTVMLTVPQDSNAKFKSNTEIESDGIELKRENETTWTLGRGGVTYNFDVADGKVIVRNADLLNSY
jgi:DUF4097 and DUF4098 domain-containing protein YvlB